MDLCSLETRYFLIWISRNSETFSNSDTQTESWEFKYPGTKCLWNLGILKFRYVARNLDTVQVKIPQSKRGILNLKF